jgi:hypothetical protein
LLTAKATASRPPIAAPKTTTAQAIQTFADWLAWVPRVPTGIALAATTGSTMIRAKARAISPPVAPASSPRAMNRFCTAVAINAREEGDGNEFIECARVAVILVPTAEV